MEVSDIKTLMKTDVIVIGAGASGLMCAIEAGKRGRSVLVLEHTGKIGAKIAISGGGRCNFTNRVVGPENYISKNPHFATSALSRFTPPDFLAMLERRQIRFEEREKGRLFCSENSRRIVDMLKAECDGASVRLLLDCGISEIRRGENFSVATNRGIFHAGSLVVATGGLALPSIGATNFGYAVARQFGMKVTALRPALVPLRFGREDAEAFSALSGISIDCIVSYKGVGFHDNILFTHKGLSGPAVLQISSHWDRNGSISVDLLPGVDIYRILMEKRHSRMLPATVLALHLPARFVKTWCDLRFKSKPLNQYAAEELESLARGLHDWRIRPTDTEGFNKAEVTLGGVDTSELSSKTMESKRAPGLYFLGELIDVTGHLGGYNLHWAWASGHAAGQAVR
ncbi:MAG: NAD(P)/FAD-dependent oxidoreductase [Syntrophobacteraceae bacterium]